MKNVTDLMMRLKRLMPPDVKPAFKTGEELIAWQQEQGLSTKRASMSTLLTATSRALFSPVNRAPAKTILPPPSVMNCCCAVNR